jgi:hypothetical protein
MVTELPGETLFALSMLRTAGIGALYEIEYVFFEG